MREIKRKAAILAAALLLSMGNVFSASAAAGDLPVKVGNIQELMKWYDDASETAPDTCQLTQELGINTAVLLGETQKARNIGVAGGKICIEAGGRLVLDNPLGAVMGPELLIEVKQGGVLELKQGELNPQEGKTAVLVRKGGSLLRSGGFKLNGAVIVREDGASDPSDPGNAGGGSGGGTGGGSGGTGGGAGGSGGTGGPGETGGSGGGTGTGESGGDGQSGESQTGPVHDLAARVITADSSGQTLIQLSYSALPADAKALYVYRSTDGTYYTKGKWNFADNGSPVWKYNFLEQPGYEATEPMQYLTYREWEEWDSLWLKIEVEGSAAQGMSNSVRLKRQEGAQSNVGIIWNDGSMDGNLWGGGQGSYEWETDGSSGISQEESSSTWERGQQSEEGGRPAYRSAPDYTWSWDEMPSGGQTASSQTQADTAASENETSKPDPLASVDSAEGSLAGNADVAAGAAASSDAAAATPDSAVAPDSAAKDSDQSAATAAQPGKQASGGLIAAAIAAAAIAAALIGGFAYILHRRRISRKE